MQRLFLVLCVAALGCTDELPDGGASESDNATTPASTRNVAFGINADYFDDFVAAVPGSQGYRGYARKPTDTYPDGFVPATWPTPAGVTAVFTLYLEHDALLAGKFDQQLLDLFETAPAGSYVTLWQEVGNLDFSQWGVFPSNIASMNHHVQRLIDNNRGGRGTDQANHVKFGPIIIGVGAINAIDGSEYSKLKALMEGGPYDFYGLDIYDGAKGWLRGGDGFVSRDKIDEKMGYFRTMAQQLSGREDPEIVIGECNSPKANNRAGMFRFLGEWMNGHHGTVMLTHYDPSGPASGPWLPCDPEHANGCATIEALDALQARYGK